MSESEAKKTFNWSTVSLASVALALLQSVCTAVVAFSAVRVAIGLTALAAVAGTYEHETGYHGDAIRIPMLALSTLGALINLFVLFRIWSLRRRESGNWRRREVTAKEKRSERWQFALAIVTLILVAAELWTHTIVFRS
jgi:hypothetical protein